MAFKVGDKALVIPGPHSYSFDKQPTVVTVVTVLEPGIYGCDNPNDDSCLWHYEEGGLRPVKEYYIEKFKEAYAKV